MCTMSGRTPILLLALALGLSCGGETPRPNLLLVSLDTTRADALSCYGGPEGATPALDRLAAEGVRFDLALSTAALTPVAHASLLTGLEPQHHGARVLIAESGVALAPDIPTLAELLSARGWSTAAFQSGFPVSSFYGLERGFDVFDECPAELAIVPGQPGIGWQTGRGQRRSDRTVDLALEWLADEQEPFFLWVHTWDPHDAQLVPPRARWTEDLPRDAAGRPRKSDALYHAEISFVDSQLGRLFDALRESGRWEDTLVVVVGDHGEGLADGQRRHGWRGHRTLYQEQLRVPFIVKGTAQGRPDGARGVVVDSMVSLTDVLPTLLDELGLPTPGPLDGRSLLPLMAGGAAPERTVVAEAVNRFDLNAAVILEKRPQDGLVHAISDGRWKLLWRPAAPDASELFDLANDPLEERDRFASEAEIVSRLLGELAGRRPWVLEPFAGVDGAPSELTLDVLADLGYAGASPGASAGGAATENLGSAWSWFCPLDGEPTEAARPCPRCGGPPVPRQGKLR